MKICILRHAYFPDDPRERKQAFALLEAGHDVTVICLRKQDQKRSENINGVHVHRLPLQHKRAGVVRYLLEYGFSFLLMYFSSTLYFLKNRFDVIQVSTMPDFLVFATAIPKLFGAKILLDLHEPTPELWVTKYGDRYRFLYNLQLGLEQKAIKFAHKAITVTSTLRQRFIERGANPDIISVVPNVCDENIFKPNPALPGPNNMNFTIITHGSIEKRYGHKTILEAISKLKKDLPNLQFLIPGNGDYKSELESIAKNLNILSNVKFLGYLSFDELLQNLNRADIGIIAMERSPYSELIDTNKMYEYISLQKPVIASRLPALEANFDDGSLKYFRPGDSDDLANCILELFQNPDSAKVQVKKALIKFDTMKWSTSKQHYTKLFDELYRK